MSYIDRIASLMGNRESGVVARLAEQSEMLPLDRLGCPEQEYLSDCLRCLLWHMAHECGCVYALCKIVPDPFTDEETRETFPVERVVPVFRASRPGILYAKCLAYATFLAGCQ